ncbi:MAG TPA: DNA replication/repair protein RecF [Wenzhouxiangella sp.]|nr:DNA replication/repair protein RecF [Wenzhouxiangella sp.]
MSLASLSIRGVRNLDNIDLNPGAGINWFVGPNGAGKTSILEALFILARGRSFRASHIRPVIQHGAAVLSVVARVAETGDMLGIERSATEWRGRINREDSRRASDFARKLPLVLVEPGSHALISGSPHDRRRFLDWLLFHVEHEYLQAWRNYSRLLRQRNAALRESASSRLLAALEQPLVAAAGRLNDSREAAVVRLEQAIHTLVDALGFRLPGKIALTYRRGHPDSTTLAEVLAQARDRELERGFTLYGPHRAELVVKSGNYAAASELSRGQQKLMAILLLLGQLQAFQKQPGLQAGAPEPMLLLDDPVSELDDEHLESLLAWLKGQSAQVWLTATELRGATKSTNVFHVEHGKVSFQSML